MSGDLRTGMNKGVDSVSPYPVLNYRNNKYELNWIYFVDIIKRYDIIIKILI